ncbi:hypothetical protein CTAYLR_005500 [Chrysophaeum taylorii]|uniref:Sulfatase N-terminal domain-containing protein n=1 Tax=Chrysophaeum taylorii TaxID=2483200 RepID=A0AAD7XJA3_9STRA|nr:hypothetical protein CTAYLR_005500 [Chrysophaeum taylorii]
MPRWAVEIAKLASTLRGRVFVSIYEDGSTDNTRTALRKLDESLAMQGIPRRVVLDDYPHREGDRIDRLARARNAALAPLYEDPSLADWVIFVNDIAARWETLAELAATPAAFDVACGMDHDQRGGLLPERSRARRFYDGWVARDLDGRIAHRGHPYWAAYVDQVLQARGTPFYVKCCWNGAIVARASMLVRVRFRRAADSDGECDDSECTVLCRDARRANYTRVVINPAVWHAYSYGESARERRRQPRAIKSVSEADRALAELSYLARVSNPTFACCSLHRGANYGWKAGHFFGCVNQSVVVENPKNEVTTPFAVGVERRRRRRQRRRRRSPPEEEEEEGGEGEGMKNARKRGRSVVMIVADDLSREGLATALTPRIDELAAKGVALSNVRILGSDRLGVCAPSRATLLTGQPWFKVTSGTRRRLLRITGPTIAERLRQFGYRTGGVGKWHADEASFRASFEVGRAVLLRAMGLTHDAAARRESGRPVLDLVDVHQDRTRKVEESRECENARLGLSACRSSHVFASASASLIRRFGSSSPYFLYCGLTAPHDPLEPPPSGVPPTLGVALPSNVKSHHPFRIPFVQNVVETDSPPEVAHAPIRAAADTASRYLVGARDEILLPFPRTATDIEARAAKYLALVAEVDDAVGAIVDEAWRDNDEDTIVVFTADHGIAAFGEHGLLGKQNLYEHSNAVPLVVAGAGAAASRVPLYLHDLAPTVLTLALGTASHGNREAPPPPEDGRDFASLFRAKAPADALPWRPRERMFVAMINTQRGVVDLGRRLKLLAYFEPGANLRARGGQLLALQLFSVDDAAETNDLLARRFATPQEAAVFYAARLNDTSSILDDDDDVMRLLRWGCSFELSMIRRSKRNRKERRDGTPRACDAFIS